jgi:hypothetical protein
MVPLSRPTPIFASPLIKPGSGGRIVTLQSPGTSAFSNNAAPDKIVNLPGGGLNNAGAQQKSTLDEEVKHTDSRPAKSFSQIGIDRQRTGTSRSKSGAPRRTGGNFHLASTQFHGSAFRPQFRSSGRFGRW